MAMEFPSRMAAAGTVRDTTSIGGTFTANARGCVVTRVGVGDYLITLDRGLALEWASLIYTPVGNPIAAAASIIQQLNTTQFQVSGGVGQVDFNFNFAILAIDESQ